MKKIITVFVSTIAGIVLISILGSVMLDMFPSLQPVWEETKTIIGELYNNSKAKYGVIATVAIIVCAFILVGSSK